MCIGTRLQRSPEIEEEVVAPRGAASGLFQFVADDVATGEAFHCGGSTVLALKDDTGGAARASLPGAACPVLLLVWHAIVQIGRCLRVASVAPLAADVVEQICEGHDPHRSTLVDDNHAAN